MDNREYILNAYKNALERVVNEIRRIPTQPEESLIMASILGTILCMRGYHRPSNVMGRACSMSLFRFLAFNADESSPSITQKYRQKLGLSQQSLDAQIVKAIEKAHNDPIYDSSTIRTLIMSSRAFLFEIESHRLIEEYGSYEKFSDTLLPMVATYFGEYLKARYPEFPEMSQDTVTLCKKFIGFVEETDDLSAMLLVA